MGSLFLELSKQESLLQMMQERGFTLCQQNGQRTYGGPPPNWGARPPPSRDCEVFIGRLPRMCFEDELIPLFLSVGELYEFRLMLDFSGTNRGYGYAHYATANGAASAIKVLNKYEIRPGHQIGVLKSKNNCRLLFGNIKPNVTEEAFKTFIRTVTENVLDVIMFTTFNQLKMTDFNISLEVEEAFLARVPRGDSTSQFAIVEYENHKAAAVARRVLIPKFGHVLAIDWAVPPKERKRNGFPEQEEFRTRLPRNLTNPKTNPRVFFSKGPTKPRPVPVLITEPSITDNIPFMPKSFHTVIDYFKYLIKFSLFTNSDRLEIPMQICYEIQKKIIDRITNLENCGQAVQLIFNYLAWYNEKKPLTMKHEVQKVLQEVKLYSDLFLYYVHNRINRGPQLNSAFEDYYTNVLPLQLNVIFRLALISTGDKKSKFSGCISTSLQFLQTIIRKCQAGDMATRDFLEATWRMFEAQQSNLPCLSEAYSWEEAKTFILHIIKIARPQIVENNFTMGRLMIAGKPQDPLVPPCDDVKAESSVGSSSQESCCSDQTTLDVFNGDSLNPWATSASSSDELCDRGNNTWYLPDSQVKRNDASYDQKFYRNSFQEVNHNK